MHIVLSNNNLNTIYAQPECKNILQYTALLTAEAYAIRLFPPAAFTAFTADLVQVLAGVSIGLDANPSPDRIGQWSVDDSRHTATR